MCVNFHQIRVAAVFKIPILLQLLLPKHPTPSAVLQVCENGRHDPRTLSLQYLPTGAKGAVEPVPGTLDSRHAA